MQSPQEVVELLKFHSKERTKHRRELCKFLRRYRHKFKTDWWLLRKMNGGWLGDLTDKKIIEYCEKILN